MSWTVVDPKVAARRDTKIITVDVPLFTDEMPLEDVMGRHLSDPASLDWLASGGVVLLATRRAAESLRSTARNAYLATEAGVRGELDRLARERQVVALRRLS